MLIAVIVLAIVIVCAWYLGVVYVANRLIKQPRRDAAYWKTHVQLQTPADAGLMFEPCDINTRDQLQLAGWFIPALKQPANGTLIYLHGVGGSRVTTISGAAEFVTNGYNVLSYDSRGSGESGGNYCTYGFYEKFDVIDAITMLQERNDGAAKKIALLGKSMGAAVALQAAAIEPRIKCVIAEASFTEFAVIANDYELREIGAITALVSSAAMHRAERLAKFSAAEISPIAAVHVSTTPKLFIHGADDQLVNAQYSRMLFAASKGAKDLWIIPHGGHTDLRTTAGEEYNERRLKFLELYLK